MKPPRLIHLLVSILLLSFSDGWAQPQTPPIPPPDPNIAGATNLVQIKPVLDLFKAGDEEHWPVQKADRWCWAAVAQIIMSSMGHTSWTQCIQADDAHPGKSWPRTCCDYAYALECNRTGWPHFEYYGFDYSRTATPLMWEELTAQMELERPVAIAVRYIDPANPRIWLGAHMGVVAGSAVSSDGKRRIFIVDPDDFHGAIWALYDEVFGDSSDTVRHMRTYFDIRPFPSPLE